MLAAQVAAGTLPPVAARVPLVPDVVEDIETIGRPGGEMRMLMASPKDTRIMVVYGYARLVAYTPNLEIVPDMLERVDVEGGRVFTLHLRPGHKWSDGQPFTSEDFRYWFEDVAGNKELSPTGLPVVLMPHGEPPRFEVLDEHTVRYTWAAAEPAVSAGPGRGEPALHLCAGALPEAVSQEICRQGDSSPRWSRRRGSATGRRCTTKKKRCTRTTTRISRRSNRGY